MNWWKIVAIAAIVLFAGSLVIRTTQAAPQEAVPAEHVAGEYKAMQILSYPKGIAEVMNKEKRAGWNFVAFVPPVEGDRQYVTLVFSR